jgi:hypothetical protein
VWLTCRAPQSDQGTQTSVPRTYSHSVNTSGSRVLRLRRSTRSEASRWSLDDLVPQQPCRKEPFIRNAISRDKTPLGRYFNASGEVVLGRATPGGGGGAGSTAGGRSKMSDEPLTREREPIERVRARLEALVRANAAPRCGARSKRTGKPCRAAAMPNGRCKVHGGKSTGPRTPEGLERSRRANCKHGHFSREAKAERSRVRAAILALRYLRITDWQR